MVDADRVAEQHQTLEGYKLADYRAVALPYYVIYVDAVVLERRPLAAVTEYLLRAVSIGLNRPDDVRQFLGLENRFFDRLVKELTEDRYLGKSNDEDLQLLARGEVLLANAFESSPQERELPVVWDLIQRRPSGYLEALVREADAKRDGLLLIRARPMRAPLVSEIPVHAVQKSWTQRRRSPAEEQSEILRLREAKRRLLRYRPAVGLVYVQEKGAGVRVRFAINGKIDDGISQGFAEQDGAGHMGITGEFAKKATTLSIRTRLKELPGEVTGVADYSLLLQKRAVTRFGLDGLRRRMEEESPEELSQRIIEKQAELEGIQAQISALPIRELMPYEVIQLTRDAVRQARKRVILTTRIPSRERLSATLIADMKSAASRGVRISILLAGKIPTETADNRWSAIRELDRAVNAVQGIEVGFLVEAKRSIFEVVVDEDLLLVCNRPPLGDASNIGAGFHPFSGVVVSDHLAVRAYVSAHLSSESLQVTKRIVARAGSRGSKVSRGADGRPAPRVKNRRTNS